MACGCKNKKTKPAGKVLNTKKATVSKTKVNNGN